MSTSITLTSNFGETVVIPVGQPRYYFTTLLPTEFAYAISVAQTSGEICTINNSVGVGYLSDVTNVDIACTDPSISLFF